ncbi:MAG TPA: ABC transporter substrate-binding protein [Firmicutes bacterium]|jgi:oligopeptide transport system substrate-binding protein|nr:ABC transporter substrate-binding protein [Bacillota bacterium]
MKKSLWIWLPIIAALLIGTVVFAKTTAKNGMAKGQVLNYNLALDPESLDPAKSVSIEEFRVEYASFEGLATFGEGDVPRPGVAEKWQITPDGKTYTFYLRKNAKWSNGDPVTARDFEYAWKRLLNPSTASPNASTLFYLKNAEDYNNGKIKDADQVGVKAKDNYTLVVTLSAPCSYFLGLTINPALYPVNRKTVEAGPDKWAGNPETYIGNGPFKMTHWTHHEKLEFVPNPYYWNKSRVKLQKLVFYAIEEQSTALTMFDTDQIDLSDELPQPELPRLTAAGLVKYSPSIGTYYYMLNTKKPPLNDPRVRKALALAIDRSQIVKYITKGGEKPALGFVPYGIPDANAKGVFRQVGGSCYADNEVAQAKKLLAEAGYSDIKKFPALEILYNTSETHKQIAEVIQQMWHDKLGINTTLVNQESKVFLQSRSQGNFQIARSSWIGDYVDPMTFLDIWAAGDNNNYTNWTNGQYDKLIDTAKTTMNSKIRYQAMHNAEKLLMDQMPIIPIYFYTRPYIIKPWVKGVRYSAVGLVDFSGVIIHAH